MRQLCVPTHLLRFLVNGYYSATGVSNVPLYIDPLLDICYTRICLTHGGQQPSVVYCVEGCRKSQLALLKISLDEAFWIFGHNAQICYLIQKWTKTYR